MSRLILPGDPSPDELEGQLVQLQRELLAQRQQSGQLVKTIIEIIGQLGLDNKLSLGPPVMQGKAYLLSIRPNDIGGTELSLDEQEKPVDGTHKSNGQARP